MLFWFQPVGHSLPGFPAYCNPQNGETVEIYQISQPQNDHPRPALQVAEIWEFPPR